MKKPLCIAIILLLIAAMLAVLLFYTLPKHFDAKNATRITVFVGATGERVEITDPDAVSNITQSITSLSFRRGKRADIDGFRYTLTWYDGDGNSLLSLSFLGDDEKLIYKGRFYHVTGDGEIDLAPINVIVNAE